MILDSAQGNALVQLDLSQIQREMPEGGAVVGPGGKTVLASLRKRGIFFLNREERVSHGIHAVSYTHLDVYKRQCSHWCPA